MKNSAPLARSLRLAVIQGLVKTGKLTRDEALELLSRPLTPDDETTVFDDSGLIDATPTEAMNAIYGDDR